MVVVVVRGTGPKDASDGKNFCVFLIVLCIPRAFISFSQHNREPISYDDALSLSYSYSFCFFFFSLVVLLCLVAFWVCSCEN